MKIAFISKSDSFGGGASRCAEILTDAFHKQRHQVSHFCYWSGKGFNSIRKPLISRFFKPIFKFRQLIEKKILGFPDLIPFELLYLIKNGILDHDIIHFHDISSAISPITVFWLAKRKPVVWTFHDCSPFTGGCLYPDNCTKYTRHCINCPQKEWPIDAAFVKTNILLRIKQLIYHTPITLLSPSLWMKKKAETFTILKTHPVNILPNGIDTDLFYPRDKNKIRHELGIPDERYVILISATNFKDPRKGGIYAVDAIRKIKELNPFVIVMGRQNKELVENLKNNETYFTGFQSDKEVISRIYAASDVFLFPSLDDNQPLSILESMACGTPVISFETGGIPEMFDHLKSGYIASKKNIHDLVKGLHFFHKERQRSSAGKLCRKTIESKHSLRLYCINHLSLYNRIIEEQIK